MASQSKKVNELRKEGADPEKLNEGEEKLLDAQKSYDKARIDEKNAEIEKCKRIESDLKKQIADERDPEKRESLENVLKKNQEYKNKCEQDTQKHGRDI